MKIGRFVTLASRRGAYGGPFDTAREQVRFLRSKHYDVYLLSAALPNDAPATTCAEDVFVECKRKLPLPRFAGVVSWRLVATIVKMIRRSDVIHISFARELGPLICAMACLLSNTPYVLQCHGMVAPKASVGLRIFDYVVTRPLIQRASAIFVLTADETSSITRVVPELKTQVVEMGNPVRQEFRLVGESTERNLSSTPLVLFAARIHPRKKFHIFAHAAELVLESNPLTKFVAVGPLDVVSSNDADALRSNAVDYRGPVPPDQLAELVQQTDVFVLPSSEEPWGNTLIGALHLGVPVVVTKSCALAEVVGNAEAGAVVLDDDPAALADSIRNLTASAPAWHRASVAAQGLASVIADSDRLHSILAATLQTAAQSRRRRPVT